MPFLRMNHCAISVVVNVTFVFIGANAMDPENRAGVVPSHPEFPLGDVRRYSAIPSEPPEAPAPEPQHDTGTSDSADAAASESKPQSNRGDSPDSHPGSLA
jgi:hypothetical protein